MPELPEVESLRRILMRSALGRSIVSARIAEPRLRRRVDSRMQREIVGRRIERISRRAKYLMIELAGDGVLLVHLGMSGSLTHRDAGFDSSQFNARHDHVEFGFDDGTALVFNDPRRFGLMKLVTRGEIERLPELRGLGPEPIGRKFDLDYLCAKSRGRRVAIKNLLMDQRIVAGIGNIYAAEILFRAAIRPTRRAGRLTHAELARIVAATPAILRAAIGSRGTTFRSYRDSRGRPGGFASRLQVYGREGEPCYRCSTPIRNTIVGQRSSFFCPHCQR
jgi:formamidopyrimidine-DNA glycosylase